MSLSAHLSGEYESQYFMGFKIFILAMDPKITLLEKILQGLSSPFLIKFKLLILA